MYKAVTNYRNFYFLFRFEVPIAFQQSNRPVPLVYSLDTRFELTNNKEVFLKNPYTSASVLDPEYDRSFAPGKYNRVCTCS